MDVHCYNVCMCVDVNVFVIQIPQHVVSPAKKKVEQSDGSYEFYSLLRVLTTCA